MLVRKEKKKQIKKPFPEGKLEIDQIIQEKGKRCGKRETKNTRHSL